MILLLIKAPTGLSLALPTDAKGNITATKTQLAMHDDMDAMAIEWGQAAGHTATETLFRVIVRGTTLSAVKKLIAKYKLPLTILHAQDAYETDTGKVTTTKGVATPIMTTTVYKQSTKTSILPFMPDVITYDPTTMKETGRAKAATITIPNCSDMAAWAI